MNFAEVDKLQVHILVDNATDTLSSTPGHVESEAAGLLRRGIRMMASKCLCCAAHGLSCAVTAWRGGQAHTLLFDTGPDEVVFERNVERLGFDMGTVEGIVLSHGHWDHCGAMLRALQMIRQRNGGRDVPTYMHPEMYRSRATKAADGSFRPFEDVPSAQQLEQHGARVVHATEAQLVVGDCFYVSGEIPRVTPFEIGLPGQHQRTLEGNSWEPDPLIMEERFVAVSVKGKGLVVFTACSHAGVINVLKHARACFPVLPLHGVLGGFHLAGANERVIPETVEAMREFDLSVIGAAHCTGWRAVGALANAFGEAVVPSAVGKLYRF